MPNILRPEKGYSFLCGLINTLSVKIGKFGTLEYDEVDLEDKESAKEMKKRIRKLKEKTIKIEQI